MGKRSRATKGVSIVAVSGGPDSVYLVYRCRSADRPLVLAHLDHQARGKESDGDRKFVERLSRSLDLPLEVGSARVRGNVPGTSSRDGKSPLSGFERKARETRYDFLKETKNKHGAREILVGHTADDQVETVLMRVLEGAGIAGLKGIPRKTDDGIERPLLDTWRADVLRYLKEQGISFRIDRSNRDTRFERNWIRHVLVPMLEKRYGKSLKRRIFALGERFREINAYVETNAYIWLKRQKIINKKKEVSKSGGEMVSIPRKAYAGLPSFLRMRILQILCHERIETSPNERLLASMDRMIVSGKPSARLNVGKGCTLRCRYGEAILSLTGQKDQSGKEDARTGRRGKDKAEKVGGEFARKKGWDAEPVVLMKGPGVYRWKRGSRKDPMVGQDDPGAILWEEREKTTTARIRRTAESSLGAVFDMEKVSSPLCIRALRAGDRIRPFGLDADKKVKEILIDRKVTREERWGRPVVCDSEGEILWIPGILRSAHAPVTRQTSRTIVLRVDAEAGDKP
jgi:tRNA(Ile)-lysidine synthase